MKFNFTSKPCNSERLDSSEHDKFRKTFIFLVFYLKIKLDVFVLFELDIALFWWKASNYDNKSKL